MTPIKTVLQFGKYKGRPLYDVYREDASYVNWLFNNTTDEMLKCDCAELLGIDEGGKIETIVIDALQSRGYSPAESAMFVRKLKTA